MILMGKLPMLVFKDNPQVHSDHDTHHQARDMDKWYVLRPINTKPRPTTGKPNTKYQNSTNWTPDTKTMLRSTFPLENCWFQEHQRLVINSRTVLNRMESRMWTEKIPPSWCTTKTQIGEECFACGRLEQTVLRVWEVN